MPYGMFINYFYAIEDQRKSQLKDLATAVRIACNGDKDAWENYIGL